MKKLIFVLGFLMVAQWAVADVTRKVISIKQDENGNLEVHTQYKVDGVEVVSRYLTEPCDDGQCYIWVTRYDAVNFINPDGTFMDDAQKVEFIGNQVDKFSDSLIRKTFVQKKNLEIKDAGIKDLIGSTKTIQSSVIELKDKDKNITATVELKTDGTLSSKSASSDAIIP